MLVGNAWDVAGVADDAGDAGGNGEVQSIQPFCRKKVGMAEKRVLPHPHCAQAKMPEVVRYLSRSKDVVVPGAWETCPKIPGVESGFGAPS